MLPERTREHLLLALSTTPRVLRRLIAPFPCDHAAWDIVVSGRFTSREHIAHLADWEEVFFERAMMTLQLERPEVPNPDETAMSAEQGYARSDPHERVEVLAERRDRFVATLRDLSEDQWQRIGLHPKNGAMTVETQAVHVLGHDGYHLAYLTQNLL